MQHILDEDIPGYFSIYFSFMLLTQICSITKKIGSPWGQHHIEERGKTLRFGSAPQLYHYQLRDLEEMA